jgi:glycerophosphoryl diester phosphodiesterase
MTSQGESDRPVHPFFSAAVNRPEVIAHRGGDGEWPGETIFAFKRALDIGVDMLEMDVHCTKDGKLAVIHYSRLRKTTNSSGRVRDFDLAEVEKFDAGHRWPSCGKLCLGGRHYPYRGLNSRGVKTGVPSLEEVFETFPDVRMNIEIKKPWQRTVKPLWELIDRYKRHEKVLVASFSTNALNAFRKLSGGSVATSASTREWLEFKFKAKYGRLPEDFQPPYQAFQASSKFLGIPLITKEFVAAAAGFKLPVHAWTVNDAKEMERVRAAGVAGIITDYPLSLLALRGRL